MTDFKTLPVYQSKDLILNALSNNQVIIVESPTGSGKTTQIPLILNEAGYTESGIIGITQPRRIATLSVSSFINRQLETSGYSPSFCAYKMRFYDTTQADTKIKILTDGMLLQELKADESLSKYSVIMVDEAHERSLNIDFILGLLKKIISVRKDLKVIISSATINTKTFSKFFTNAPIISIKTKTYNVDVKYYPSKTNSDTDYLSRSVCEIINVLLRDFKKSKYKDNKDTLVFLPGEFDIKTTIQSLYANCDHTHLQIYPLYSRLNKEEQELVFEETQPQKMKVVLATNIAETSLTINGIKAVIDCGLSKINYYNQFDFTSSLVTRPISKASAMQRAGRAGRTCNGICYRLYSEEDFENRAMYTPEEILRTDLSEVVLRMIDLGIKDFEKFSFITKPDRKALESGEKTLIKLGAIDNERNLTETGNLMVKFPLLPRHAKCIVSAIQTDIDFIKPVIICVSFLSCKTPFVLPAGEEDYARNAHKKFTGVFGDFIGYQFLYKRYNELKSAEEKQTYCSNNYLDYQSMEEIVHVTNQLCEITREIGIPVIEKQPENTQEFAERCLKPVISGLIQYVCVKKKASVYSTLNTDEIYIHPGSAYFREPPMYIVAGEIVLTTKMYARTVSPLNKQWIDAVDSALAGKLKTLSKTTQKADNYKTTSVKATGKTYNLFGKLYPVLLESGKKQKPVVLIPSEEVKGLYRTYRHSSRHPKNINAAVVFNGYYLNYGERLYDVLSSAKSYNFENSDIISDITDKIFYIDNINDMKRYLSQLMKLSPLKKYKNHLGYVELVCSSHGYFFHVNKNFNEAINNTAYSLLSITDAINDRDFTKEYNRIVKFLD